MLGFIASAEPTAFLVLLSRLIERGVGVRLIHAKESGPFLESILMTILSFLKVSCLTESFAYEYIPKRLSLMVLEHL